MLPTFLALFSITAEVVDQGYMVSLSQAARMNLLQIYSIVLDKFEDGEYNLNPALCVMMADHGITPDHTQPPSRSRPISSFPSYACSMASVTLAIWSSASRHSSRSFTASPSSSASARYSPLPPSRPYYSSVA